VAVRWSLSETHRSEWFGVAATGEKITGKGTTTFPLADDRRQACPVMERRLKGPRSHSLPMNSTDESAGKVWTRPAPEG
jgi:hypothetical protein